ncbi:MAG: tryptophan synthase subunit alpha [Bacteroidota bacterium]
MDNRITRLFADPNRQILSIFTTAGYPQLDSLVPTIQALDAAGVDMIEIGMPFSDPIADGSTIQHSNQVALGHGITLSQILDQLADIRQHTDMPLLMMGYLNPVVQYGMERFLEKISEIGIDGVILPDLPMAEYQAMYQEKFEAANLSNIFLITPQTSEARIRLIDEVSQGFIYVVSTDATTGRTEGFGDTHRAYFSRIADLGLTNPTLIGFGISDQGTYQTACEYSRGAIIGSAFIKSQGKEESVEEFVKRIR